MEFKYKKNQSREEREKESAQLRIKYPDKVPVVLEKDPASKIVELKKTKYLLPKKSTVNQFQENIRRKAEIPGESALFLQARTKYSLAGEKTMEEVYNSYKDKDGFLYIMYATELIYG